MNHRPAAAVATLICVLDATYLAAGLRSRADAAPDAQDAQTFADRATTIRSTNAQNQEPTIRSVKVTASRYRFDPAIIDVFQDDLVKVELRTDDIAHSLTLDGYRIAKRVSPGQPVTFEFRADQAGTFSYYCNLQLDDGCRQMRGQLVVKPRR